MENQTHISMKTERLFMRTVTEADAGMLNELDKDGAEFASEEAAIKWIRWVRERNAEGRLIVNFYVWLTQTDECVGRVYIHSKPELDGEIEVGYGMAEEHRCKGYATEAGKALVQYAFEKAGQDVLAAIIKPENTASRRVIEKLGVENCGVRTVPDENNVICEFDYYRLYRDDWLKRRISARI